MITKRLWPPLAAFLFLSTLLPGDEHAAVLYEKGKGRKEKLARMEFRSEAGKEKARIEWTDGGGKPAVTEELETEKGKLLRYSIQQRQIGESGAIAVTGNKLQAEYTRDGKTQTAKETYDDKLLIRPTVVPYLEKNWDRLMRGETLEVRYFVLDRLEAVEFNFSRHQETRLNGKEVVTFIMKPSGFLVAAFVDPLTFTFDKSSRRIVEMTGRSLTKKNAGGKWKDVDIEMVYEYPPR